MDIYEKQAFELLHFHADGIFFYDQKKFLKAAYAANNQPRTSWQKNFGNYSDFPKRSGGGRNVNWQK